MECECCCEEVPPALVWQGCNNHACSAIVCLQCHHTYTEKLSREGCMYCNPLEQPFTIQVQPSPVLLRPEQPRPVFVSFVVFCFSPLLGLMGLNILFKTYQTLFCEIHDCQDTWHQPLTYLWHWLPGLCIYLGLRCLLRTCTDMLRTEDSELLFISHRFQASRV